MTGFRITVICSNGHKWQVPVECQDCPGHEPQVPMQPGFRRPGAIQQWREKRRLRREADRFEWGSE